MYLINFLLDIRKLSERIVLNKNGRVRRVVENYMLPNSNKQPIKLIQTWISEGDDDFNYYY